MIEYVSVSGNKGVDQKLGYLALKTTVAGAKAKHIVELPKEFATIVNEVVAGRSVKIYADSDISLDFSFEANISDSLFISVTLSGYLIDIP